MRVLLEKNLGFGVSAIEILLHSLLQLALSSSLAHFATPFMARFTVHLISFNSNPRMSTTQNPRIREMSSKICSHCLYSTCLWLMAIQSCNSYHFLIMEIFYLTSPRSFQLHLFPESWTSRVSICQKAGAENQHAVNAGKERWIGGWFTSVSHLSRGRLVYLGATRSIQYPC